MSKYLDLLLDECIDRMNAGESIEACLAHYPERSAELEPLLLALWDAGDIIANMPGAEARSLVRQRLDFAAITSKRGYHKGRQIPTMLRWPRVWATGVIVLLLVLVGFGLRWIFTPEQAAVIAQPNFRLLISDQQNAIGDFGSLKVSVSRIGVLRGGEGGGWEVIGLDPAAVVDLTRLQGLNAEEIWEGNLPEGQYREVFIYVDNAVGMLLGGTAAKVVVPSGNLQISKPFAVTADGLAISFIYDVTVVAAGSDYILLPQLEQSGATERFHELRSGELTVQVIGGTVAPGEMITVRVTSRMNPIGGALVVVNDVKVGTTDENGLKALRVPSNDELKIEVEKGRAEGELEINLERQAGDEGEEVKLKLEIVTGDVIPGKRVTLAVTANGSPLAGALVTVDDREIGTTGQDGQVYFVVADVDKLEIKAVKGEMEGELDIDLGGQS
jgi:hypothetical protein